MKINIPGLPQPVDLNDISKMIPIVIAIITALVGLAGATGSLSSSGDDPEPNPPSIGQPSQKGYLIYDVGRMIIPRDTIQMKGKNYPDSQRDDFTHKFPLDRNYKSFKTTIGFIDKYEKENAGYTAYLVIKGNGSILKEVTIKPGDIVNIDVPLENVQNFSIQYEKRNVQGEKARDQRGIGLGNPTFYL